MLETNTIRYGTDGFSFSKILLQSGTEVFNIQNSALVKVCESPATDDIFESYGMSDLADLTLTLIKSKPNMTILIKSASNDSITTNYKGTPLPKLLLAKNDIIISDTTTRIDNFTLSATSNGSSNLKIIYSTDSGITWNSYKSNSEVSVNISDNTNIKTNGLSISEFNGITDWNTIITNKKIRFGYYLEANNITDSIYTDLLTMQVDMNGAWGLADQEIDFTFNFDQSNVATIKLLTSGDFNISLV